MRVRATSLTSAMRWASSRTTAWSSSAPTSSGRERLRAAIVLTVRGRADRDGALGHGVGELVPGVDELVELEVERPEVGAHDAPVQLLAREGQVEQVDERRLQLAPGLLAQVRLDAREMGRGGCGGHVGSSG
jgi:hypothetical protein